MVLAGGPGGGLFGRTGLHPAAGSRAYPQIPDARAGRRTGGRLPLIHDELLLDGSSRLKLATFVTTWMEPEADRLMAEAFDKNMIENMIDKDEYPQTAEIERRCVNMVAELFNAPQDGDAIGASTIGSSEAVMLAGLAPGGEHGASGSAGPSRRAPGCYPRRECHPGSPVVLGGNAFTSDQASKWSTAATNCSHSGSTGRCSRAAATRNSRPLGHGTGWEART